MFGYTWATGLLSLSLGAWAGFDWVAGYDRKYRQFLDDETILLESVTSLEVYLSNMYFSIGTLMELWSDLPSLQWLCLSPSW